MLFSSKLSKCISVVLASSAFYSNSLVGAITDEEFERYRKFYVRFAKDLAKDFEPNDKEKSLYTKILNIGLGKDKCVCDYIEEIPYKWKMSLEIWSRMLIYRIIYKMKLKTTNTNEQKSEGFDKTENILIRSEESERFKEVIYRLFDCFKLTGFVGGKYSYDNDFNTFCTSYLSRSFDRIARYIFDGHDLSYIKMRLKRSTLDVFFDLILRGGFTSSVINRDGWKILRNVIDHPEKRQSQKETIFKIFNEAHDGRIKIQRGIYEHNCEMFDCKEIMEDPIKYYFDNYRIVESFVEALIEFIEVLEK